MTHKIHNIFQLLVFVSCAAGCSSGFLGLAPLGDRKDYAQARDFYEAGQYPQAIKELTEYIEKTKNVKRREARAYRLLGKSYEQLDQYNKALEVYLEALEFHPKNVPLLLEAANLYQFTGLTNRSVELYDRALQIEPDSLAALAGQAANYSTSGFYSKAREFYDRFFELNPSAAPLYRARYAQTFLAQHNYQDAFINITMALSGDTTNADFWLLSAKALYGLHKPQEAMQNLDTALLLDPKRPQLLAYKALWQYQAADYKGSLATVKQLLKQNPENSLALFIQSLNWLKQGKTQQARQNWQQIITLDPASFTGKTAQALLAADEIPPFLSI